MIVCTAVSLISTTCVALMAYAFARLRFFGRRYGLFGLLLIQIFPIGIAVSAYYFFLLKLTEWTDGHVGLETYSGLILLLTRHRDGVLRLALQGLYRLDAEGAGGGGLRRRSHPAAGPAVRDPPDGPPDDRRGLPAGLHRHLQRIPPLEPRLHRRPGQVHTSARAAGLHLQPLHRELGSVRGGRRHRLAAADARLHPHAAPSRLWAGARAQSRDKPPTQGESHAQETADSSFRSSCSSRPGSRRCGPARLHAVANPGFEDGDVATASPSGWRSRRRPRRRLHRGRRALAAASRLTHWSAERLRGRDHAEVDRHSTTAGTRSAPGYGGAPGRTTARSGSTAAPTHDARSRCRCSLGQWLADRRLGRGRARSSCTIVLRTNAAGGEWAQLRRRRPRRRRGAALSILGADVSSLAKSEDKGGVVPRRLTARRGDALEILEDHGPELDPAARRGSIRQTATTTRPSC